MQSLRASRLPPASVLQAAPPELQAALASARRSLSLALHKLSSDIYSHRGRCLLELLQNADDAPYHPPQPPPPDSSSSSRRSQQQQALVAPPCMRFLLHVKGGRAVSLSSFHNERGFSPRDVAAICQVPPTTHPPARQQPTGGWW